jgi:hypothetical protein
MAAHVLKQEDLLIPAIGWANGSAMVVMFVDCCVGGGQYFMYYSYCRNPTGREFFVPAGTLSSSVGNQSIASSYRYCCWLL